MTYIDIVNRVLRRLRENEVTTVNETPYSRLIGDLVNVTKRDIEDSWDWGALRGTLTATTFDNLFNYVLAGGSNRLRIIDVINDTTNVVMTPRTTRWFNDTFLILPVLKGAPTDFNLNGVDPDGDAQIDFYPIPDETYLIRVNAIYPQAELENDSDVIQVNAQLVIEGTLARAISERGDDGGYTEQEQRFLKMLADLISIEANQRSDEITWGAS